MNASTDSDRPTDPGAPSFPPTLEETPAPRRTSAMAVAAGFLGAVSFVIPFLGLLAWPLGRRALRRVERSNGTLGGEDYARAGAIMGVMSTVLYGWLAAYVVLGPGFGPRPHYNGSSMKNSSQLRGQHQGMVIFANSNNSFLPGLDATGAPLPDGPATGESGPGTSPAAREWLLLNGQYFTGELAINPVDDKSKWTTGRVTTANFSYALLSIADTAADEGRRAEWKDNANSQAVMISDRNTGADASDAHVRSLWTTTNGEWKGNLVWGDNHAGFEASAGGKANVFQTRYLATTNTGDNLFADGAENPAGATECAVRGFNTLMVYE